MVARFHGLSRPAVHRHGSAGDHRSRGRGSAAHRDVLRRNAPQLGMGGNHQQPVRLFLWTSRSPLDPEGRRDVLDIIERLRGTTTVVLSTRTCLHRRRACMRPRRDPRLQAAHHRGADRRAARAARPARLSHRSRAPPAGSARAGCASNQPWVRELRVDGGSLSRDPVVAVPALLPILAAGHARIVRERARPSLEDVFLHLVASGDEPVGDTPSSWPERPPTARRPDRPETRRSRMECPITHGGSPGKCARAQPRVPSSWPEPPTR